MNNQKSKWAWSYLALMISFLITSCTQSSQPAPNPQTVLAILRQYPGGVLTDNQLLKGAGDVEYLISFDIQTTPAAVITYYEPLLQPLHIEGYAPQGAIRNNVPVDYEWRYKGCPYHVIEMSVTLHKVYLSYGYGPCI